MQAIFTAGRNKYLQASSDWVLLQNLRHSHLRKHKSSRKRNVRNYLSNWRGGVIKATVKITVAFI